MSLLQEGQVRPQLVELCLRHGIPEAASLTLPHQLSQAMQERWLRKTEHQYQIPGGPPSSDDITLLNALNLVEEIPAPVRAYDGVFILGATVTAVRKRLAFLLQQYKKDTNLEFHTVYMLGGQRPLDPNKESQDILSTPAELPFKAEWSPPLHPATTEADMMEWIFRQSELPYWRGVFIDAQLQPTPDGKNRHPNTTDTVKELLNSTPKRSVYRTQEETIMITPQPGMYLSVSSQPFVARQTMNVRQAFPAEYDVVGIGYAAPPTTPLKTFLDEIVRLLFEESKL